MTFPSHTPAKKEFVLPTPALVEAIEAEWKGQKKFSVANMPLTALAYTAIDKIGEDKDAIIEMLMAYLDTDTLTYRASAEKLQKRQQQEWDPVLDWVSKKFGAKWDTATGVMPMEQPEALHQAIRKRLQQCDAMQLAACFLLASGFSSLALMLAVLEGHMSTEKAFHLSRLEEESQAEEWGHDKEAEQRTGRLQAEIAQAERFLRLLTTG